jgi:hypothetical protein
MPTPLELISSQLQSLLAGANLEIDGKRIVPGFADWRERYHEPLAHGVTEFVFDAILPTPAKPGANGRNGRWSPNDTGTLQVPL